MAWAKVWPRLRRARPPSFGGLPLVGLDDARLEGAAAPDDRYEPGVLGPDRCTLHLREERAVSQKAGLDHLRHPGREFPRREGGQQAGGDEDAARLMKGAGQVLARRQVDAGLSSHRAVDHREERRRNLVIVDPPQVGGGGEPGEVPDDPAAHRKERRRPVEALGGQEVEGPSKFGDRLGFLARGYGQDRTVPEDPPERGALLAGHVGVGEDGHVPAGPGELVHQVAQFGRQVLAKEDRIGALAELDAEGFRHESPTPWPASAALSTDLTPGPPPQAIPVRRSYRRAIGRRTQKW